MSENNHEASGLKTLLSRLGRTAVGVLENRGELLAVELQEERARLIRLLILAMSLLFLGLLGALLLTSAIIFLFPSDYRVYAAGGFAVLYLGGAVAIFFSLKANLKDEPFAESLKQIRKDKSLLDVFE